MPEPTSTAPRTTTRTARQLASRLAAAAAAVRDRLEAILATASDGPLARLLRTLRDARLEGPREIADMYAQTIAYGLLAARIADPSRPATNDLLTDPFIAALVEAGVSLERLGIAAIVELLDAAELARIVEDFGAQNPEEDPVLRLYEHFLAAYDPRRRARRGVFYTPRPVVTFIVRSVDAALRADFGLADGLADTTTWAELLARRPDLELPAGVAPDQPFVQILDPATGTGTFLVEIVDHIHKSLTAKWTALGHPPDRITELWRAYVPAHLLPRLHGYELMLAPHSIAHLELALKLRETGVHPRPGERAQIFLTNALAPARDAPPASLDEDPLARELWAADAVKRDRRFTVVIGNPPYAGISANMSPDARHLVEAYKIVDGHALAERKQWLQDDYVKFMRAAQLQIDRSGVGVIGLVTNHGYLDNPTFRGMRQSLQASFSSKMYLLDLHGNAARPVRGVDENVFDIRQGVAVIVAVRGPGEAAVLHAGLTGTRPFKYAWLAGHDVMNVTWTALTPGSPLHLFTPHDDAHRAEYERGWRLDVAMPVHCAGFITARDHFVVDLDEPTLLARIEAFADLERSDDDIRRAHFSGRGAAVYPDGDTRGWKLPEARRRVAADPHRSARTTLCSYRPFDRRWIYWADWMVDWPRPEVSGHMLAGTNLAFHVCRQTVDDEWAHILVARGLIDDCYVSNRTRERGYTHPLYLHTADQRAPNFAPDFLAALAAAVDVPQTAPHGLPDGLRAEDLFYYIYAVCFSPGYRRRHAAQLQRGFPRIPLPGRRSLVVELAALGEELVGLHLGESPAPQVSAYVGPAAPVVGRVRWSDGAVRLDAEHPEAAFHGVPAAVWGFRVGGYRPCEKWLRDRRGRTLSAADIAHYQHMLGAAARTLELAPRIDEVIARHGGWPAAFHG